MIQIKTTKIVFPELAFQKRDAAKLRGYIGTFFREESELLHNHLENGESRFKYPLVQYKVIDNIPCLTGYNEGALLLEDLFFRIKEIKIDNEVYPINQKDIIIKAEELGISSSNYLYKFETLWMPLNQENHIKYLGFEKRKREGLLENVLKGNLLSLMKAFDYTAEQKIRANLETEERRTMFKNKEMFAFYGRFSVNVKIPDFMGIGKSVSRGYGCIKKYTR